jgi:hypothetical protein
MSYTGKLWNLTGQFSKEKFYFPKGSISPYIVTLKLTPDQDLIPGNYRLGISILTLTYQMML